jgi:peptidoglycan hydrolase FlgJ
MSALPPLASVSPAADTQDARLRQAARQLEGAFVEQMLKAMRETVPEDGGFRGGAGEEVFTALLDQHLSARVPVGGTGGLTEALVRQLRAALGVAAVPSDSTTGDP